MNRAARWASILICASVLWVAFTDNISVWPVRNSIEYMAVRAWWNFAGEPDRGKTGIVAGKIADSAGKPVPDALVLLSEWDGRLHKIDADSLGNFRIADVPMGFYRLAAIAPGYDGGQSEGLFRGITVRPGQESLASLRLRATGTRLLPPLSSPQPSDPQTLVCKSPIPGEARRETLSFGDGSLKDLVFLYRPTSALELKVPVLLAVYPGPVDTWECVSIGLAQAGYAVVAVGPAYGLDLTQDVDSLQRLISMIKAGGLQGADPARIAALGGSYSALLLELLMVRNPGLDAVVLLGPPTDMFDFRRRFEREAFIPPFGLDRALIALGLPSRDPLRYLNHSMVYRVRHGMPPTLIFHSYQDEIVPYQQSSLLADSLRKKGVEAELHLFDGASHYLLEDNGTSSVIYYQTIDFLSRHGMAPVSGGGRRDEVRL